MNLQKGILAVLVAVMVVMVGIRFWPSDERAVRKQLGKIETLGSKARDEQPVDALLRAKQLADLFDDPCTLQVASADFRGVYSRKQIQDRIVMARGSYAKATVSIHDLDINILGNDQATILCTLRVKGEGQSRTEADVQELEADMRKVAGDWLFTRLTLEAVLER